MAASSVEPLRMLVAKERIEDLRGNLLRFTDASKTEDGKAGIHIPQKDLKLGIKPLPLPKERFDLPNFGSFSLQGAISSSLSLFALF